MSRTTFFFLTVYVAAGTLIWAAFDKSWKVFALVCVWAVPLAIFRSYVDRLR